MLINGRSDYERLSTPPDDAGTAPCWFPLVNKSFPHAAVGDRFLHPPFHQCPVGMDRQLSINSSLSCPSSHYSNGFNRFWPYYRTSRLTIKGRIVLESCRFMHLHQLGRTRHVLGVLLFQIPSYCKMGRRRRRPSCLKNSRITHWISTLMVRQLIRLYLPSVPYPLTH